MAAYHPLKDHELSVGIVTASGTPLSLVSRQLWLKTDVLSKPVKLQDKCGNYRKPEFVHGTFLAKRCGKKRTTGGNWWWDVKLKNALTPEGLYEKLEAEKALQLSESWLREYEGKEWGLLMDSVDRGCVPPSWRSATQDDLSDSSTRLQTDTVVDTDGAGAHYPESTTAVDGDDSDITVALADDPACIDLLELDIQNAQPTKSPDQQLEIAGQGDIVMF